jgi:hypothetical protein
MRNVVGLSGSIALLVVACSANEPNKLFNSPNKNTVGGSSAAGNGAGSNTDGGTGGTSDTNGGSAGSVPIDIGNGGTSSSLCVAGEDADGDGWTTEQGDCNDCDKLVNPGALDVVNYVLDADGNPTADVAETQVDEDCDGTPTDPAAPASCDEGLGPKIGDPLDAARAIGLCNVGVAENPDDPRDRKWGVIAASFSNINGAFLVTPPKSGADTNLQLGILPGFGSATNPQEGSTLFALSSGVARAPGQPSAVKDMCGNSKSFSGQTSYPPGFPKEGDCGKGGKPNDGIALDMKIRVPTNAKSFKIRFKFFSCEYPDYTCSSFNDVFAVLMAPSPLEKGDPMADGNNASANVAFEATAAGKKNVIGVNNTGFLTACKKDAQAPEYKNCGSEAGLAGSGFEGHAASAWLETQVPIPEFPAGADRVISLRFAIWDSSDSILDSSAVVDGFEWSADPGTGVGTEIVPVPN